jgi:hypothetical protein
LGSRLRCILSNPSRIQVGSETPTSPAAVRQEKCLAQRTIEEQLAQIEVQQAKEDAELAARPDADSLGASRQAELREALWRERQLMERVRELERKRGEPPDELGGFMHRMFDTFYSEERVRHAELAVRPDAAKIAGSLQKALEEVIERENQLQHRVKELEAEGEIAQQPSTQ